MKNKVFMLLGCCTIILALVFLIVGCGGSESNSKSPTSKSVSQQETEAQQQTSPPPPPRPEVTIGGLRYQFTSVTRQDHIDSDMGGGPGDFIIIGATISNETNGNVNIPPQPGADSVCLENKATGERYGTDVITNSPMNFYTSMGYYTVNHVSNILGGDSKSGYMICNLSPGSIRQNTAVSSPSDLKLVFYNYQEGGDPSNIARVAEVDLAQVH